MAELPIRVIDSRKEKERKQYEKMVELVDEMLSLHRHLEKASTENDRMIMRRQIKSIDSKIDQLVYDLYGLEKEEIEIIEEATKTT